MPVADITALFCKRIKSIMVEYEWFLVLGSGMVDDKVLLFMASVVIRADFILILSIRHVHGLFVDALE